MEKPRPKPTTRRNETENSLHMQKNTWSHSHSTLPALFRIKNYLNFFSKKNNKEI